MSKIMLAICLIVIALFVVFDLLHHDYKDAILNIGIFAIGFIIAQIVKIQKRKQK
jgi:hypothetical protein